MELDSEQKYLQHIARLTEENNQLLRRIERRDRAARTGKALHRIIVLAMFVGAYFYLQPYLKNLESMYQTAMQQLTQLQSATDSLNPFIKKQ